MKFWRSNYLSYSSVHVCLDYLPLFSPKFLKSVSKINNCILFSYVFICQSSNGWSTSLSFFLFLIYSPLIFWGLKYGACGDLIRLYFQSISNPCIDLLIPLLLRWLAWVQVGPSRSSAYVGCQHLILFIDFFIGLYFLFFNGVGWGVLVERLPRWAYWEKQEKKRKILFQISMPWCWS